MSVEDAGYPPGSALTVVNCSVHTAACIRVHVYIYKYIYTYIYIYIHRRYPSVFATLLQPALLIDIIIDLQGIVHTFKFIYIDKCTLFIHKNTPISLLSCIQYSIYHRHDVQGRVLTAKVP